MKIYVESGHPSRLVSKTTEDGSALRGELIDVKLNPDDVRDTWWTQNILVWMLIPRYLFRSISQEEKVLYPRDGFAGSKELREDIFEIDMKGHPIAAVKRWDTDNQSFNSGVLLIDNGLWKRENMTEAVGE